MGAHFPALEERIKLNILVHSGLRMEPVLPAVDQINFVTRVKVPALMLSGIYDFDFRPETSQIPMSDLLGTPALGTKNILPTSSTRIPDSARRSCQGVCIPSERACCADRHTTGFPSP